MKKLVSHAATVFPVKDVRKTADFYRDELGFEITFEWGDPIRYAVTNREESVFLHFSKMDSDFTPPADHTMLYVFVDDVDAIYKEFESKNVDISNPIGDREYGMRDFDVRDPNGFILSFAKHIS